MYSSQIRLIINHNCNSDEAQRLPHSVFTALAMVSLNSLTTLAVAQYDFLQQDISAQNTNQSI